MGILHFKEPISIVSCGTSAGKLESEGALGNIFDCVDKSDRFGAPTWEQAESKMQKRALACAIHRAGLEAGEIDALFAGDLLNQCLGSTFGVMGFGIPYFGIFGACSTLGEGMILASLLLEAGKGQTCAVSVSSHNCSAERQFRFPLEYGGQRPPTAQWTVTGAGAYILRRGRFPGAPRITKALVGTVLDSGIKDAGNMGAAMAPAAADTLSRFFDESGDTPDDYDLILTGDLGSEGSAILKELLIGQRLDISSVHKDCGNLIYDRRRQDVHSGGSGCGCSGIVFGAHILPMLFRGEIRRMLLMPTGALMNAASIQQGMSIPGIAPLVVIQASDTASDTAIYAFNTPDHQSENNPTNPPKGY